MTPSLRDNAARDLMSAQLDEVFRPATLSAPADSTRTKGKTGGQNLYSTDTVRHED